jgi:hypothetical protein
VSEWATRAELCKRLGKSAEEMDAALLPWRTLTWRIRRPDSRRLDAYEREYRVEDVEEVLAEVVGTNCAKR